MEKRKGSKGRKRKVARLKRTVLYKLKATKSKSTRLKIVQGLVRVEELWVNDVLVEALEDPSEEIRENIIRELGKRETLELDRICQKLHGQIWYVKCSALRILANRKNESAAEHIKSVISDRNAEVRRTAARVLGDIGGKEALALLSKLAQDRNHFVKKTAEEALERASQVRFS